MFTSDSICTLDNRLGPWTFETNWAFDLRFGLLNCVSVLARTYVPVPVPAHACVNASALVPATASIPASAKIRYDTARKFSLADKMKKRKAEEAQEAALKNAAKAPIPDYGSE